MEAPQNWSADAVRRLIAELLAQTRAAPGVWRAVGAPFEVKVCLRADGWEISGRAPTGHEQTFFRQSEDETSSLLLTCIANELHYSDLDRHAVKAFADRANHLYGQSSLD